MGLSQSAYANHRKSLGLSGGTRQAVSLAVKEGRIAKLPDGTIDPAEADAMWAANTATNAATPQTAAARTKREPPLPTAKDADYHEERAKHEAAKRELTELKLAEAQRRLLDGAEVRRAVIDGFRKLRDKIRAVPSQVAQDVAAETDVARCGVLMLEALDTALGELAEVADPVAPDVGEGA